MRSDIPRSIETVERGKTGKQHILLSPPCEKFTDADAVELIKQVNNNKIISVGYNNNEMNERRERYL